MSSQKDSTLESFLGLPPPEFECIATSQEIRDRGSIFVANIYAGTSVKEARAAHAHVKNTVHGPRPATHEVAAWRCMVLKAGKSGLSGPDDFELRMGSVDDGEQHAGAKVLKVMQEDGIIDAVVIVSRWYGGVMLGPVRFAHFETCAREVCRTFRLKDDIASLISTLLSLDGVLSSLRADLARSLPSDSNTSNARSNVPGPAATKAPNYDALQESLDINKAKRLITARENAIKSVKSAIKRRHETRRNE